MKAKDETILKLWLTSQRWCCSVVGPFFIVLGIFWTVQTVSFENGAKHTIGSIVGLVPYQDQDNGVQYAAVFQFVDSDGTLHRKESSLHTAPAGYGAGDHVRIVYHLDRPNDARIDSFVQLWFFPLTFVGTGLMLSFFAVWLWSRHLRKAASSQI